MTTIRKFIELTNCIDWKCVDSNGQITKSKLDNKSPLPDLKDYTIVSKRETQSHKVVTKGGVTIIAPETELTHIKEGFGALVCDVENKTCTFAETLNEGLTIDGQLFLVQYNVHQPKNWNHVSLSGIFEEVKNIEPIRLVNHIAVKYHNGKPNIVHVIDAIESHLGLSGIVHTDTDKSGNSGTIWLSGDTIPDRFDVNDTNEVVSELQSYGITNVISVPKSA